MNACARNAYSSSKLLDYADESALLVTSYSTTPMSLRYSFVTVSRARPSAGEEQMSVWSAARHVCQREERDLLQQQRGFRVCDLVFWV